MTRNPLQKQWIFALIPFAFTSCLHLELTPMEPVPVPAEPAQPGAATSPANSTQPAAAAAITAPAPQPEAPVTLPQTSIPSALVGATTANVGLVRMELLPQYDPLFGGGATDLNVLVRLSAGGQLSPTRPNLDLAIVLDRSGSMAGAKLADAKQAGLELIKLLEPRDRVTLITYDDTVVVNERLRPVDAAGYDALRGALLQVTEGGSTALGPAIIEALSILEPASRGDKDISHVVLLSDGLANVGEQRPDVLGARAAMGFTKGVSTSTLGVGLDYNEDLMTKLADQGGGRYHFIKDSATIPTVLTEELAGLASTVAREVVLTIKNSPAVSGVTAFGYPTEVKDGVTHVRVGSMRAGQTREIIVRLKVTPTATPTLALGDFGLRFKDTTQDGKLQEGMAALTVKVSNDELAVRQAEHTEVTVRVAEVESAELLEQAARAVEARDYTNARQLLNNNITQTRSKARATNNKKLEMQAVELEEALKQVDKAEVSESEQKNFTKEQKSKSYNKMK